jgi:[protein-PII] uridylyltransferase
MLTTQTGIHPSHLNRTYQERVLLHAAASFPVSAHLSDQTEISRRFRTFLKLEDERLKMAHSLGATGCETAEARSFVIDLVVKRAYRAGVSLCEAAGILNGAQNGCAMVALGGYGRAELAPYSDLDILFLHTGKRSTQIRQMVEQVLRLLWDSGLTIGHSFRSVSECVAAARTDPHLQTALVATRLLAGDSSLYASLSEALGKDRRKRVVTFIAAVCCERDARYAKFGATVCLQEPNIKESAGGIRDLHTALWATHARYGWGTLEELRAQNLISRDEHRRVALAYDFIWRVRYAAHLLMRRKTDRLELDIQSVLAQQFGYKSGAYLLDSEAFMRDYYRRASELHRFSKALLARASEPETKGSRWRSKPSGGALAEPFLIAGGRLQMDGDAEVLTKEPLRILDAFAVAQAACVPFSHNLHQAIKQSLATVTKEFRTSAEASSAFLKLLRRRGRVGHVLRLMHETGFLARFIPEFSRISLLVQHDLYHHYTVDEHTLRAIEALDELHDSQDKQRAHLRIIFDEIADPALLYLSILLHDIGKGRGSGHIPRGVKIAEHVCRHLGLDEKDTAKVILMVRQHVTMAHLAQRRDLNEPQVVAGFSSALKTLDALNMLLLLTYSDLNAVAPGVWSEWKGTLLWELYRRARTLMMGGDAPAEESVRTARFVEQVVAALDGFLPPSEVERHIALLPDRYLRVTLPDAAATHLHLIEELKSDIFARRWFRHGRTSTELIICTPDQHGLFARIAGTLAAHGIEILSAELNTREDGIALDVLMLREASTRHAIDVERYAAIERNLRSAITGEYDVAARVERWRTQHAPRKRASVFNTRRRKLPHIICDNDAAQTSTLIEVHAADEPGLAYKIASALATLGLDIVCARIATERSDALDVFYVTDADGMKLSEIMLQSIEIALNNKLSPADAVALIPEPPKFKEKMR